MRAFLLLESGGHFVNTVNTHVCTYCTGKLKNYSRNIRLPAISGSFFIGPSHLSAPLLSIAVSRVLCLVLCETKCYKNQKEANWKSVENRKAIPHPLKWSGGIDRTLRGLSTVEALKWSTSGLNNWKADHVSLKPIWRGSVLMWVPQTICPSAAVASSFVLRMRLTFWLFNLRWRIC